MNGRLKELLVSKANDLDWKVEIDEHCWEFQKYSPAGEDFWFGVNGGDVVAGVLEYYETFDPEDHVMGLMEAKKNGLSGVPRLKELVDVVGALHEVETKYYEEDNDDE